MKKSRLVPIDDHVVSTICDVSLVAGGSDCGCDLAMTNVSGRSGAFATPPAVTNAIANHESEITTAMRVVRSRT
jgi:hypothetical protein